MHMIAPPSEDNVGHFFKVQKSRMMLLHVRVHIHTSMCVCVCMYVMYMYMYMYVCSHCMHVQVLVGVKMYSHCSCKPYMLVEVFNHMTHPEHREQDSWSNTNTAAQ